MLTESELEAIRIETFDGNAESLMYMRNDHSIWIGRLIHTEADARLLLGPLKHHPIGDEQVDFKDGTKSNRIDRIEFLLQYWDEPSQIERLEEAAGLLEQLCAETTADDGFMEFYQTDHLVLESLCGAVWDRVRAHQKAEKTI